MNATHMNEQILTSYFPNDELESDIENIPLHLLIAEDDPQTRDLLRRSLAKDNYYITTVENGNLAWEVLQDKDNPPRLALLDWMMPGLNGVELCRRLTQRKMPFVYTIILTAMSQNEDIITGLEAGAHEFLTKPFDIHVLRTRVASGERIVKLEMLLQMKNEIIQEYVEKLEILVERRAREMIENKEYNPEQIIY